MAVTKGLLSGTSAYEGQAYEVTTSVTTVHTGPTATTSIDEIWIYATNASAADAVLHIGWGANPDTLDDNRIKLTIPTKTGYKLVIPGLILKGNASALTVQCKASATNAINLTGYVNHITA